MCPVRFAIAHHALRVCEDRSVILKVCLGNILIQHAAGSSDVQATYEWPSVIDLLVFISRQAQSSHLKLGPEKARHRPHRGPVAVALRASGGTGKATSLPAKAFLSVQPHYESPVHMLLYCFSIFPLQKLHYGDLVSVRHGYLRIHLRCRCARLVLRFNHRRTRLCGPRWCVKGNL